MEDVHGQRSSVNRKADIIGSVKVAMKNVENTLRHRKQDGRPLRDVQKLIDERVFHVVDGKGNPTELTAIQELELLDALCTYFTDKSSLSDPKLRYAVFEAVFFGRENDAKLHESRVTIFVRLLSLAVIMPCVPLLVDASTWMQKGAASSKSATAIIKSLFATLVEDFCSCDNHQEDENEFSVHRSLCQLITLCPNFAIHFLAYALTNYDWFVVPPLALLEVAAEWMCGNNKLFLRPFRDMSKTATVVPLVKLLSQCIGKLCCVCIVYSLEPANTRSPRTDAFMSKLRFAILQIMQLVPKVNVDSCCLLMGKNVAGALKRINDAAKLQSSDDVTSALDALSQFMQVALVSKCFFGNRKDFDLSLCSELAYGHPLFNHVLNMLIS